jgi:error-prone DNA polymerase
LAERFSGRLWIAVELHAGPDDASKLVDLQALAEACDLPLVAAGDVHMHIKARRPVQDVLTALRLKTTVFDAGYALFRMASGTYGPPAPVAPLSAGTAG